MVDLAREAFSTNNFGLAADIYERTIRESGPTSELYLGLADSFARGYKFAKAFNAYNNAYRYGKVTPEKLKHLVVGLIETVKQDVANSNGGSHETKRSCMFTCGVCRGLLADPVTIPCGHTFCRKCLEKDKTKTCEVCSCVHYKLKTKNLSSNVVLINLIQKLFPDECKAAQLKKEGNGYFEKRDFQSAIKVYSQALEIAPQDHLLRSNRCHAYASLDEFSSALEDAEMVVQLRPDWPKGYFRKGAALYGLGHYEDAAVAFLQCLALDQKVSSAKEYLSKALDKILSALPPDDPKAAARLQQTNPSVLQQLIEGNFSTSVLPVDLSSKLSDLAEIVKETIQTANTCPQEPTPQVYTGKTQQPKNELRPSAPVDILNQKLRCNSLPDCSALDHEEIEKATRPRTHSPIPSPPPSRKRLRIPSTASSGPLSPTHQLPHKFMKSSVSADNEEHIVNPAALSVDDLECGLCYRLFFEPVTTPCGHTFCRKCLDRCLDHTVACPMCKGNLSEYLAERRQANTDAIQCIMEKYFKEESEERGRINDEEMQELAKMGSSQQCEIPVFVCTLSFPTIPCPLHIFEPRYRLMVRQCMESGTRQFGMCFPTEDNDAEFSDYGCMLEIRDVQYFPDGRSVVDTIGGRRFKVLSRGKRDGYCTAKVEFISDKPIDNEELQDVIALQTSLHGQVKDWLKKLPSLHRERITRHFGELPPLEQNPATSHSGPAWAWWAVSVLPLDPRVQMALLAMSSFKERLEAIKKVLDYLSRRGSR